MSRLGGTPPAVRAAAERVLNDLASDPAFAAHVARAEIDRLVAAGDMIPRERLQLGPGLELTPVGRLAEVEAALAKALNALDQDTPDVDVALGVLLDVLPEDEGSAAPTEDSDGNETKGRAAPEDSDEARHVPEDSDSRPPGMAAPEDSDAKAEDSANADEKPAKTPAKKTTGSRRSRELVKKTKDGRPTAMPTDDVEHHCAHCGTLVEFEVAKMSWIKNREVRCTDDFNLPRAAS